MSSGLVRPATISDADEIAAVHVACWREAYSHLLSREFLAGLDPSARAQMWREGIAADRGDILVAGLGGRIVGFASAVPAEDGPRDLQLQSIYLLAAHHGGGLGQALLDAVVGERPAFLWVAEDNPRARAFYVRNHFVPDGARETIAQMQGLVTIRMVR